MKENGRDIIEMLYRNFSPESDVKPQGTRRQMFSD
jgi:hypothetical protein